MRKPVQIIGTSLAAVAILGGTSAVASAAPAFAHHGFARPLAQHTLAQHRFVHQVASFDQRKAALVAALTAADSRLSDLQSKLSTLAASDPTGRAAQTLAWVAQAKQQVETLLSQVQAATDEQELNALLAQYITPSGTAPIPTVPTAPGTSS